MEGRAHTGEVIANAFIHPHLVEKLETQRPRVRQLQGIARQRIHELASRVISRDGLGLGLFPAGSEGRKQNYLVAGRKVNTGFPCSLIISLWAAKCFDPFEHLTGRLPLAGASDCGVQSAATG